jgi:hypothetical protein
MTFVAAHFSKYSTKYHKKPEISVEVHLNSGVWHKTHEFYFINKSHCKLLGPGNCADQNLSEHFLKDEKLRPDLVKEDRIWPFLGKDRPKLDCK